MITCTCGGTVNALSEAVECCVKGESIDYYAGKFVPSLRYLSLCKPCYAAAKSAGVVLETEAEREAWLALDEPLGVIY